MASFFKKINPKLNRSASNNQVINNNNNHNQNQNDSIIDQEDHHSSSLQNSPAQLGNKSPSIPPPLIALPSPPISQLRDRLSPKINQNQSSPQYSYDNNPTPSIPLNPVITKITPIEKNVKKFNVHQNNEIKYNNNKPYNNNNNIQNIPNSDSNNIILNDTPFAQYQSTPWKKIKLYNSPFPRFGHTVSSFTSNSGDIYLMGGLSGNNVYGDIWILEPSTNNNNLNNSNSYISSPIENIQKIPSPRTGHCSVLIGNAFIIFGGDTAINDENQSLDNKLYFFNITSLKWTITSSIGIKPCGRYGSQISVLNFEISPNNWSSQLYLFGGQLNNQYFNDLWKFDLSKFRDQKNQWIKLIPNGDIPPPLTNHSMIAYKNNLYIFGGQNDLIINDKLYCYNSIENSWSICKLNGPNLPPALSNHSATIFGSLLFIYGGKLANDSNSNDLFIIDLSNFSCWKLKSNLPFNPGPRYGHSITVDINKEKLLIMGGDIYDNDFNGVNDTSSIENIDESNFNLLSSVIYECDISKIDTFIDKPLIKNSHAESNLNSIFNGNNDNLNNKEKIINDYNEARSRSNIDLNESIDYDDKFTSSTPLQISDDELEINDSIHTEVEEGKDIKQEIEENTINDNDKQQTKDDESLNSNSDSNFNSNSNSKIEDIDDTVNITTNSIRSNGLDDNLHEQLDRVSSSIIKGKNFSNLTPKLINQNKLNEHTNKETTPDSFKTPNLNESNDINTEDYLVPSLSTPLIKETSTIPFSPALIEKDNIKLQKLVQMVNDIKSEMKISISNADSQIVKLENEKNKLIEELNNVKLENNELKVIKEVDYSKLNEPGLAMKNVELQKFIINELSSIESLKNIMKEQDEKINYFSLQMKSKESLNDKIFELTNENSQLKNKIKLLEMSYNSKETSNNNNNINKLNNKLDLLVNKWNTIGPQSNINNLEIEKINKENDEMKKNLKEYEVLFEEIKTSLDRSHKALLLSQTENNKLKNQIKVTNEQFDEFRMKKRIYSSSSLRIPSISKEFKENEPIDDNKDGNNKNDVLNNENDDDLIVDNSLIDDRYEIKIKDLEANLFIVSQERDQIKEELVSLKKQMYYNSKVE